MVSSGSASARGPELPASGHVTLSLGRLTERPLSETGPLAPPRQDRFAPRRWPLYRSPRRRIESLSMSRRAETSSPLTASPGRRSQTDAPTVTALLRAWHEGDASALEDLMPLLYDDLRRVARAHLRQERASHSLQATALVHEVYLRLAKGGRFTADSRTQFLALAAHLIRQILVDHARRRGSTKRGGLTTFVGLDDEAATVHPPAVDILALDAALEELGGFDPRQRDLVELRYFGGLTIAEAAVALQVSTATVEREWAVARAWLYQRLRG